MALSGSVGKGGMNVHADVRVVQQALNIVREAEQLSPIAVDGIAGPQTCAAILAFQKRHTRFSDGRIDPHGQTFRELERIVGPLAEARARLNMARVMDRLALELQSRRLAVGAPLQYVFDQLNGAVRRLRPGFATSL